jgi:peptidoglycan-associated lipoprotein
MTAIVTQYKERTSVPHILGSIKTITYGKECPLDPGHDEEAWAKNRRAHFLTR